MQPDVTRLAAWALAMAFAILVLIGIARYALPAWSLAAVISLYAAVVWCWPGLALFALPIVIPAYDLGLWTGWMAVGESDFFVLATLAVLVIRNPLSVQDLRLRGPTGLVLAAFTAIWIIATLVGLWSPLGAPASDNAFLRPDNALRLCKGLVEALALLPFLRRRQRLHGDAITLLGWGLAAGLTVVTLIVIAERMLFASLMDFGTEYRVVGPFSSMRVGGGHIGAYAAMALPFSLTLVQLRPRWLGAILALLACLCGGYTIGVSFARTAYAACVTGMIVTAVGWLWVSSRNRMRSAAVGIVPIVVVLGLLAAAAGFTGMHARFAASAIDFLTRQDNWRAGMAVRDENIPATMFGMGLGTYPRAMLERSPVNRPSDLVIRQDAAGSYVSMRVETAFFLGQKIAGPRAGAVNLVLRARSPEGAAVIDTLICDKVLLYSKNCRGQQVRLDQSAAWVTVRATIGTDGVGGGALFDLLRRPVELSLSGPVGHTIEVRDINLTNAFGHPLLANGDFAHGLDRWIFTDDSHIPWRMKNQYLMLFFETGVLGLIAYCALAAVALAGGIRALQNGSVLGAAVTGSVAAFLISGLFDNLLEVPRIATLFFLVCWCGLMQWDARYAPRNSDARASHS